MPPYNHTRFQRVFGTPSVSEQLAPPVGPTFQLVSRPGAQVPLIEQQVFGAAMGLARQALDRAYGIVIARAGGAPAGHGIVPGAFDQHFFYCFREVAGTPAFTAALATVRNNITRIRTGLWDPALQIVDVNPNRAQGASGYVRCAYSELLRIRDPLRELTFAGRIHVRFGAYNSGNTLVNQRNAAMTVVHEGAHKFLGARDWVYNGGGSAGWIAMQAIAPGPPPQVLTAARALNNADSYAEFVCAMP